MNELTVRCTEVSLACKDSPITAYLRQFAAEKTGILITPDTDPLKIRQMITGVQDLMIQAAKNGEFVDENENYVINHHFAGGVYAREMHIPAGHVVVGKIHKQENLHFLSKGSATVITEEGGVEEVQAGVMMKSPKGVKRLLITHADTIWTVLHATDETDVDKIEADVIAKKYSDIGWQDPTPLIEKKEA